MTGSKSERLTRFELDDADDLAATDMMSVPVLTDPDVGMEPLVEWAGATGHVVEVLSRDAWAEGATAHT